MTDWVAGVTRLLAKGGLWLGVGISVGLAVGSVILVAVVVIHWPADYFKLAVAGADGRAVKRHVLAAIGKNLAGVVLVLLGLVMALPGIPGQGLLTMIVGLTMIDFPGKRGLERRLIGRPHILRAINRLRARFQRAPLQMD
jgi:small-conductance mechanosensitive channel